MSEKGRRAMMSRVEGWRGAGVEERGAAALGQLFDDRLQLRSL